MYINNAKIAASKIMNSFVIGVTALVTLINLMFFLASFSESALKYGAMAFAVGGFFLLLTAVGVAIIIWRVLAVRKFTKARIYNSLIEEDHDGIIDYETFASMTGYSLSQVIKEIMWLYRHGYLINITLGRTAVRVDLRSDEKEFIKVSCPSCGAHITIRKNGGGRCDHCGTFMRAKGDANV